MNKKAISSRRRFLAKATAVTMAGSSLTELIGSEKESQKKKPLGKAEHCIFLWLGGGAGHIDTWDPKRKGDPQKKTAGSYYDSIDTAIDDVQVCKHLSRCAPILDRFNLIRTLNHDVIDEHAAATNRMHTGRPTSGTILYPSLGSVVAHRRGSAGEGVPAYVVMGYPNLTRGPGFLGAQNSYIYLTDTESGPRGLARQAEITESRQKRREKLLGNLRSSYLRRNGSEQILSDYDAVVGQSLRLAGPNFMNIFQLDKEPSTLRESYGGEFGQRCLLARRLIQSGVRFIEVAHNLNFVNGTGWDVHLKGILNQHLLIEELDKALSTLVLDLEKHRLLDKTLVVVGTEFGRPAQFDAGGGRGHHSKAFSAVLAGGGLNSGNTIGQTDELGMKIISGPVSVPDLHATIYSTLRIDIDNELYAGDRPVPVTDGGKPLKKLFV